MSDSEAADHNGSEGPPPVEHDPMAVFARTGDRIAGREGYTGIGGIDAVHRYLVQRYHWTLEGVASGSPLEGGVTLGRPLRGRVN